MLRGLNYTSPRLSPARNSRRFCWSRQPPWSVDKTRALLWRPGKEAAMLPSEAERRKTWHLPRPSPYYRLNPLDGQVPVIKMKGNDTVIFPPRRAWGLRKKASCDTCHFWASGLWPASLPSFAGQFQEVPSHVEARLCLVDCRPMASSAIHSHMHTHTHRGRGSASSRSCIPAHSGPQLSSLCLLPICFHFCLSY